jgi:hypothetical protein
MLAGIQGFGMRVIATLLLLCLSACGSAHHAMEGGQRRDIRNVAVFSAVGNQVHLRRKAIFQNDERMALVDWTLDSSIAEIVRAAVRESELHPNVVVVNYDPAQLTPVYAESSVATYVDPKRVSAALRSLIDGKNVDTVVLVSRTHPESIRFYSAKNLLVGDIYNAELSYLVTVPDAGSMQVKGRSGGRVERQYFPSEAQKMPWRPDLALDSSPQAVAALQKELEPLLREDIPWAIWRAGFRSPDGY